jgi:hypothetical protein
MRFLGLPGDRAIEVPARFSSGDCLEVILAPGPLPQDRGDIFPAECVVANDGGELAADTDRERDGGEGEGLGEDLP